MSEYPLLLFAQPQSTSKRSIKAFPPKLNFPKGRRQVDKFTPKFEALEKAFESRKAELNQSLAGIEPEQVLVLETVGSIADFYKAVEKIEGLEWLVSQDEDELQADEDFYKLDKQGVRQAGELTGHLYLVMQNQRGMAELLALWQRFRQNPDKPKFEGQTKWRDLFKQLKEVRYWNTEDRLRETGLLEDWEESLAAGEQTARVEIEFWYRRQEADRNNATMSVASLIAAEQGRVISATVIEEIGYHGLLAELPAQAVGKVLRHQEVHLLKADQVMFFRPVGQSIAVLPESEPLAVLLPEQLAQVSNPQPVVALLDGLPLENHQLLSGRLIVDDPDGWEASYVAADRCHGTAMASLIAHGELDASEQPLTRPIYTRPLLKPSARDWRRPREEAIPEDVLPVDLVHRAVKRIFEGEGNEPAVAPTVRIINFSIGDQSRPFDRFPSPLARLLDYLAHKYQVLFVVSAGNHPGPLRLGITRNEFAARKSDPAKVQATVLQVVNGQARLRRVLSPAEAINALTIGALHEDQAPSSPLGLRINPLSSAGLPSPVSAQGHGFKRSLKPEVFFAGGRQPYIESLGDSFSDATLMISDQAVAPGQKVATPGPNAGDLRATRYTRGTSNATALATRTAVQVYEMLEALAAEQTDDEAASLQEKYFPVLVKALLAHGAAWGDVRDPFKQAVGQVSDQLMARLLGYGQCWLPRILTCSPERVTLLSFNQFSEEGAHLYSLPLPPSLSGKAVWRRLTITLAWLTAINPQHNKYRRAALWFEPYGVDENDGNHSTLLKTSRYQTKTNWRVVRKGTLQHEIFTGNNATVFVDGDELKVQVNCRAEAGETTGIVPYGLVVSLETKADIGVKVYQEVRERIRPRVGIMPRT
jgi:hypothetical protein